MLIAIGSSSLRGELQRSCTAMGMVETRCWNEVVQQSSGRGQNDAAPLSRSLHLVIASRD